VAVIAVPRVNASPELSLVPERERAELRDYLGPAYDEDRLRRYELQLDEEFETFDDEASFYRASEAYLYNLTAFAMTRTKLPYLRELTRRVPVGSRLLDYGCGIGSDGLLLLDAGYRVEFADFDNPSVEYLRWRLRRRGIEAAIHDLDGTIPGGFDAVYSFDVIEHVPDPVAFIGELEARAEVVAVNFLEPVPGETALHHPLPVDRLLSHCAHRRVLSYRVHHGRSHLVLYRPGATGARDRILGRAVLAWGRLRHRLARARRSTLNLTARR
jgi:SAM-dependent methyltransferase